MRCSEIITRLELLSPPSFAEEWDNVGLLVGRLDQEISSVYIALDVTDKVIDEAIQCGADMIITHHPLIFSGLKKVTDGDLVGNRLIKLIQNDISYYAMHTNYDVLGMAELSGLKMNFKDPEVLEVTVCEEKPEGIGRIANLSEAVTLKRFS